MKLKYWFLIITLVMTSSLVTKPHEVSADVNGPLTFASFQVDNMIYRGSVISLTGSGFNLITEVWLNAQDAPIPTIFKPVPTIHTDTQLSFKIPDYANLGLYSIQVSVGNTGYSVIKDGIQWTFLVREIQQGPTSDNASPTGTNVLGSDGTVYRIESGRTRSPYTSAGAFTSYKFNSWNNVRQASVADMALPLTIYYKQGSTTPSTYFIPPRNGSLINDNGTVYLITEGLRTGFTANSIFLALGYSYSNVYPGDTSFMYTLPNTDTDIYRHRDGTLINLNGTLYAMHQGDRIGIPSISVLESWGYWASDAVTANKADKDETTVLYTAPPRLVDQMSFPPFH